MSALAVESNDPHFEPLVMLDEVAVETGEEQEEALCTLRSKLYVFIKEDVYGGETRNNYWKERGLGDVKILKHKSTGQCRILGGVAAQTIAVAAKMELCARRRPTCKIES